MRSRSVSDEDDDDEDDAGSLLSQRKISTHTQQEQNREFTRDTITLNKTHVCTGE
jgi:hypothetical protein